MSYEYSGHEAEFDEEIDDEAPRPRRWVSVLVFFVLIAIGSGAAFAWHGHDGALLTASSGVSPRAPEAAQEALLKSLAEAQQRMAAATQRSQELLQAQDAEIKRLTDTIAQLATRLDAMSARNAQGSVPPPQPKKPAPKVVAPKPSAPAPLSLAPEGKQ